MSTPTAAWSTRDLYASLGHAGWGGVLAGRSMTGVRKTLEALIHSLPYGSGAGKATVAQIASWSALSPEWTRRCLYILEDLRLIAWRRGGVKAGKAVPSDFLVSKRSLVQLIRHEGARWSRAMAAKAARERARVAQLGTIWRRHKRNPLSNHAELSPYLHSTSGGDPSASASHEREKPMKIACIHGQPDTNTCGMCHMARRRGGLNFDVTTLHAPKQQQRGDARRGREACRAAVRQTQEHQDTL